MKKIFITKILFIQALCTMMLSCLQSSSSASAVVGNSYADLPNRPLQIVSLGDSYASGPGITPFLSQDCLRSGANYAHVAAQILHAKLRDVSCSGAVSQDFYTAQVSHSKAIAPPQFNALTGHDDVVVVSIGGNDAKLVSAFAACAYQQFTVWGCHNELMNVQERMKHQVRNNLLRVYRHIRDKDPRAEIIAVGYGSILSNIWCLNSPFSPQTSQDMIDTLNLMNTVIQQVIPEVHGKYFNVQAITKGHDLCSVHPWYYGVIPGQINEGFIGHPNVTAMDVEGRYLAGFIKRTWQP